MFENAKVGDKLFSLVYGWGEVVEDIDKMSSQITVKFENERDTFTLDGKMYETDMYPTLFWDKIEFDIPKKPLPKLKVDTRVLVGNSKDRINIKRHFKEFDERGYIVCFLNGLTSWTSHGVISTWEYWEVEE